MEILKLRVASNSILVGELLCLIDLIIEILIIEEDGDKHLIFKRKNIML